MPFCPLKSFLPFDSPKNLKNQNFEEMKRNYLGYHHFTHAYQKLQPYDVQFQRYRLKRIEFFVILGHFLPFYDPNNPEKKDFEKKEKIIPGDIILLHMCNINEDQSCMVLEV